MPIPTALNVEVLKRGLSEKELDRILGIYNKNKKIKYFRDRSITLSEPLSERENLILQDFLFTRMSEKEIAEKYQIKVSNVASRINNLCRRALYQNRDILK